MNVIGNDLFQVPAVALTKEPTRGADWLKPKLTTGYVLFDGGVTTPACVTTDVGDSRLLVGECGIVVPAQNSEALAEGIIRSLSGKQPELGNIARQGGRFGAEAADTTLGAAHRSMRRHPRVAAAAQAPGDRERARLVAVDGIVLRASVSLSEAAASNRPK